MTARIQVKPARGRERKNTTFDIAHAHQVLRHIGDPMFTLTKCAVSRIPAASSCRARAALEGLCGSSRAWGWRNGTHCTSVSRAKTEGSFSQADVCTCARAPPGSRKVWCREMLTREVEKCVSRRVGTRKRVAPWTKLRRATYVHTRND